VVNRTFYSPSFLVLSVPRNATATFSPFFFFRRPESNVPKTNKRFLTSIIKSTDDHNKTVLRAQALAAQVIKKEREEAERRERRARAQEAVDARRRDEDRYRSSRKRRRGEGEDEGEEGDEERRGRRRRHRRRGRRPRSTSTEQRRERRVDDPMPVDGSKRKDEDGYSKRDGPYPSSSRTPPSPTRSPRSLSSKLPNHQPRPQPPPPSRSPSPTPPPPPPLPPTLSSKMDKYFEESYDPRFDVAPLAKTPNVPATGLVGGDGEFDGWDAMLELIRMRREDKEERRRLERLGLVDKVSSSSKKKKKGKSTAMAEVVGKGASGIMEIEYTKKGAVREWDMGKEGF
jgi:hypothetical protein